MFKDRLSGPAPRLATLVKGAWRRVVGHPVIRSITPIGWTLIVGLPLSAVVGWRAGWLEFRALAVMAAVVMAVAGVFVLRRREHTVELELHRPRVQAGDQALGRILVKAAGGKSSGPTTMELPVGRAVATFRVGSMAPDDEHEEMFEIPTRRRGIVTIGPVRSVQTDPLGAVSRQKFLTDQLELFIHPRIAHVSSGAIGFLKDVEGVATTNLSSSDVSFHALREYRPGDDRRAVHWKTTARTGKLMVRQFEETMRAHLVIMLATREADYERPEDFELAVAVAGSLAASALRDERQVSVLTSTGELRFPNALGLLDRLSGVELTRDGRDHRSLAVQAGDVAGMSVAAFITGTTPPVTLRAAQLALSPGIFPFAIRCGMSLDVAKRKVGALTVLDVSRLSELPAAVGSLS